MKKFGLLVGVESYGKGSGIDPLRFASNDVIEVGNALQSECGFETRILTCADGFDEPTGTAILDEIKEASLRLEPEDLFLFMFAGHGLEREDDQSGKRSYLLPSDASLTWQRNLLELEDLKWALDKVECQQRMMFLDCCRNDPFHGRGQEDNRMGDRLSRDLQAVGQRGAATLRTTLLMKACRAGERAWEWDANRHGVFSYYLLEGLRGKAWRDGRLEAMDLCAHVQSSVLRWSEKQSLTQWPDFQQLEGAGRILLKDGGELLPSPAVPPQPPSRPLEVHWHVYDEGKELGSIPEGQLIQALRDGNISRRAEVWKEGMSGWTLVSNLAPLNRVLPPERMVTPPPPPPTRGPRIGKEWAVPDLGLEMVWCEPGSFRMGDLTGVGYEKPITTVKLTKGFWLGKYPVTQGEYLAFMGQNPSHFKDSGYRAPVDKVNWNDAVEFCRRLTIQEQAEDRLPDGYEYALPTEAQWEYACRAGSQGDYCYRSSEDELGDYGWYGGNSDGQTHPAGQKKPNQWGLYDMHGNVWEWCQDNWGDKLRGGEQTDYSGSKGGSNRVYRGGGWDDGAWFCRCSCRSWSSPGIQFDNLGFRLALRSS